MEVFNTLLLFHVKIYPCQNRITIYSAPDKLIADLYKTRIIYGVYLYSFIVIGHNIFSFLLIFNEALYIMIIAINM